MDKNKLIDANVLIDLVTEQELYFDKAKELFEVINKGNFKGTVSMISISITSYYAEKYIGLERSKQAFGKIKAICEALSAKSESLDWALNSSFPDLEDAIQNHIAESNGCTTIITRNTKDFKKSNLAVLTPEEFLATQEL